MSSCRICSHLKASVTPVKPQRHELIFPALLQSGSSLDVPALVTPAIDKIFLHLSKGYDPAHGGFSKRGPKFPSPAQNLVILSRIAADSHGINEIKADERERGKGEKAAEMGMRMLRALWMGGIRDWVGNGLARYSVDEYWRLPHFEKML